MPKVNCDVVGCSSSTYRINKRKKEPFVEHGDKNVVKGRFPNCERPYTVFQLRWQKNKRERCMDLGFQTRKSKQNKMEPNKQW